MPIVRDFSRKCIIIHLDGIKYLIAFIPTQKKKSAISCTFQIYLTVLTLVGNLSNCLFCMLIAYELSIFFCQLSTFQENCILTTSTFILQVTFKLLIFTINHINLEKSVISHVPGNMCHPLTLTHDC